MIIKDGGGYLVSPSDLARAGACEFGFLRGVDERLARPPGTPRPPEPAEPDLSIMGRAISLGLTHEAAYVAALMSHFGPADAPDAGRGVYTVTRADGETWDDLRDRTLAALAGGVDAVVQGCVYDGSLLGFADFLIKVPTAEGHAYLVSDTKVARRAKVPALLQLGAYADVLSAHGVPIHDEVALVLGTTRGFTPSDFGDVRFPTWDVAAVTRLRLARLRAVLDRHLVPDSHGVIAPVRWDDEFLSRCGSCDACVAAIRESRDLLLVARLSGHQRTRLQAHGIRTIDELAELTGVPDAAGVELEVPSPFEHISAGTLHRLHEQAALQVRRYPPKRSGPVTDEPIVDVYDPVALQRLPARSDGDLFFDFEGDPLWFDDAGLGVAAGIHAVDPERRWGIEYLFGIWDPARAPGDPFVHFWADDRAQERAALVAFCEYVRRVRARHPDMHIYHYAPYEPSALKRLAGLHEAEEDYVDELLRGGVFVDLYQVVRDSLRISEESYSIKSLEPLYRSEQRQGVTNAADSVEEYARYCAAEDDDERAARRAAILAYNRDDCVSTLQLRDYLLGLVGADGAPDPTPADADISRRPPFDPTALLGYAERRSGDDPMRAGEAQAARLLVSAVDFWWRENKPFWWAHFARLSDPPEVWINPDDWVVFDQVEVVSDWEVPPGGRLERRRLRAKGTLARGGARPPKQLGWLLYPRAAWPGVPDDEVPPGAHRLAVSNLGDVAFVVGDGGAFTMEFDEKLRTRDQGRRPDLFPMGASVGLVATKTLVEAMVDQAEAASRAVAAGGEPRFAGWDILCRRPPRMRTGGLASVQAGDYAAAMVDTLQRLDDSYLAVQGPPGTGKTFQAAQVIAALVDDPGWRIGVVAQSHAVVHHLLDGLIGKGVDPKRIATDAKGGDGVPWQVLRTGKDWREFLEQPGGAVVGGTAWDFTNRKRMPDFERGVDRPPLDLLVVEEAGQYSLAMTLAAATAARNVLLLGDPQQLPQVSQGTHPQPVDDSALGWLAQGGTLPDRFGYFLATTHRMHPDLTRVVSRYSYERRLRADPCTARRRLVVDGAVVAPGLVVASVDHAGRTTESPEEAQRVIEVVASALRGEWTDATVNGSMPARRMTQRDVAVVAPYNGQVQLIRQELDAVGLTEVLVGTVDKMQGREAVVVVVSMTVSSPQDAPRGLDFLLSRNRVNVAISRAKHRAVVVCSPRLTDYLPATPDALVRLGGFAGVVVEGAAVD